MKLIDADALWMEFIHRMDYCDDILEIVEEMPEAVVRCGECKYLAPGGICETFADDMIEPSASDYCSYGERRTDES